jgi:hypothetical protein
MGRAGLEPASNGLCVRDMQGVLALASGSRIGLGAVICSRFADSELVGNNDVRPMNTSMRASSTLISAMPAARSRTDREFVRTAVDAV